MRQPHHRVALACTRRLHQERGQQLHRASPTAHTQRPQLCSVSPPIHMLATLSGVLSVLLFHDRGTLDSSHQTASELRVELDRLRSEVLAYEDAILTTKREIDNTKRERREIELNYDLIKEEFQLQLHKLMQAQPGRPGVRDGAAQPTEQRATARTSS